MTGLAPLGPMIAAHVRIEVLRLLRNRGFTVATIALPLLLFFFVGRPAAARDPAHAPLVLASFGAFGVLSVALFSVAGNIAIERGQRAIALMRVSPLRPAAYICGKLAATLLFSIAIIALLLGLGALVGIPIAAADVPSLMLRLLAGAIPFALLGSAIGWGVSPSAATAVINLLYLPMSFASGLFGPTDDLPGVLRDIAPGLPTYHYAQLAHGAVGPAEPAATALLWLVAYTVFFAAITRLAYRREERRRWE